ncbi:MAG: hypothetical protein OXG15_00365 [Gammaproteobacteria bacterium]|nr:hypothetical protein [Gammaproteobacteria bacterium]
MVALKKGDDGITVALILLGRLGNSDRLCKLSASEDDRSTKNAMTNILNGGNVEPNLGG